MRLEDNMMPVLTGLVFAIVLGTTVQNTDGLIRYFSGEKDVQVADDVFFVRAGTSSTLDVLANDFAGGALSEASIKIVSAPSCGEAISLGNGISYKRSETCKGAISFTYCVENGDDCVAGDVELTVKPAPVAVAENVEPDEGALVPLSTTPFPEPVANNATPLPQAEKSFIKAYVVTLGPIDGSESQGVSQRATLIGRYMVDAYKGDLDRMPVPGDPQSSRFLDADTRLSAVGSARFLADYGDLINFGAAAKIPGGGDVGSDMPVADDVIQIELDGVSKVRDASQG